MLKILEFSFAETVICFNKHLDYSLQHLEFACKTTASSFKNRDIMPQIGVYTLNRKSVAFVPHISNMFVRIHNIDISKISVSAVFLRWWRIVHNVLNSIWRFIKRNIKSCDLSWCTAYHSHQIHIFMRFSVRSLPDKSIKFINF